jgi:hypothetical protein
LLEIDRMLQNVGREEGRGCREKKKKTNDSDTDEESVQVSID